MKHYILLAILFTSLAAATYGGSRIGAYKQQCETALDNQVLQQTGFVDRRNIKIAEFID